MVSAKIFLAAIVFGAAACAGAAAQNAISESKRKLIAEIVAIMKMDSQMTEITDEILKGMESSFPVGYNQAVDSNPSLSPQEKSILKAGVAESYKSFSIKLRQRMRDGVNYAKFIDEGVFPLYDKMFTEQELHDLVIFYKTPTGQKVVSTMPQLFAESQKIAQEKLVPQIMPIIRQLLDEEYRNIDRRRNGTETNVGPPPPMKKPPARNN
jgi:hypothetical protein